MKSPAPSDASPFLLALTQAGADVLVAVKVVPGASRSRVAGMLGDRLKVAVAAPPEDGKANQALCALLGEVLGVPAKRIQVTAGQSNPRKTVRISGLTAPEAATRLSESA